MNNENSVISPNQQQQIPINNNLKHGNKKIIFIFLVILLLLAGFVGMTFIYISQQRNLVKGQIEEQVKNFTALEGVYSDILSTIKESGTTQDKNQLLKNLNNEDSNVLGLENDESIKQMRRLSELYKEGIETTNNIKTTNDKILSSSTKPLASYYLFSISDSVSKTEKFSKDTASLLTYLDKINQLGIDLVSWGFSFVISVQESIVRGADETSISALESKIIELDNIKEGYLAMDTSSLSKELRSEHVASTDEFETVKKLFNDIIDSLKVKDADALEKSLQSLIIQGASSSETSLVESVSFWQNDPTIRQAGELKREWVELSGKL